MDENNKFDKYLRRAKEFYNSSNFQNALDYIKQVVPSERSFDYWVLSCEVYLSLNKFNEADNAISNAIHIDNKSSKVWYLKAKVSVGLENYKKALRASKRALSIEEKAEYRQLYIEMCNKLGVEPEINHKHTQNYSLNYPNKLNNIISLTKPKNIKLLNEKLLTHDVYYTILNSIMQDSINKTRNATGSIYDKIEEFASCFVNLEYQSLDEKNGSYIFNSVVVGGDLNLSFKIATLIHELAHHLLSEIFEQTLMYVYDSQKTDLIEAFAYYALFYKEEHILMNEYCAHCVECHFMPYNGENFESYNKILEKFDLNNSIDLKKVKDAIILANTLAQDIIYMLEQFITSKLEDEIKIQYVKDCLHNTYCLGTKFKTTEKYDELTKFSLIRYILAEALFNVNRNLSYADLLAFKEQFRKANRNL